MRFLKKQIFEYICRVYRGKIQYSYKIIKQY